MRNTVVSLLILIMVAVFAGAVSAQQQNGFTKDPRILAYDKGPAKIDVSKYPGEMKAAYKVFMRRCGACHTIARAINSEYALDEEWQHYIRQMMDRGGSLISADDAKTIYGFVTYDSKDRKKALYTKKLAESGTK
jgi:hypothetical protein